jgi:hypothetical protein
VNSSRPQPTRVSVAQAIGLVLVIALTTAGLRWNSARVAPRPEPSGDLLVTPLHEPWADVYLPAGHGPFPTLLFSPGFGTPIASYKTFLTDIASNGFVVVAVPHPQLADPDNAQLFDIAPLAGQSLVTALDSLRHGSLLARVDTSRIAAVGHSIGGAGAALACADPRFRAAVDLDGSLYGRVVHEGVACPFLLIERSLTRMDTTDAPVFSEERSQGRLHEDSVLAHSRLVDWVTIDDLDHMSFTDQGLAFVSANWLKETAGLRLNAARSQRIAADLTLGFLAQQLDVKLERPHIDDRLPDGVHRVSK